MAVFIDVVHEVLAALEPRTMKQTERAGSSLLTHWSTMVLTLLLVSCCTAAWAQQTEYQPGESRANQHQYLSSHNSYQGDISLASALDDWNVWDIELDVRWRDTCATDDTTFYVLHHCGDTAGEGTLAGKLIEILGSRRMSEGFFFLNIELNDGYACLGCFDSPAFPGDYLQRLQDLILTVFPPGSVYGWTEFRDTDGLKWPSISELVRRGRHVAIHINKEQEAASSTIFFRRGGQNGRDYKNTVVLNTSDESLDGSAGLEDRYMTRRYPEAYCFLESGSATALAIQHGFTFASTNCIEYQGSTNKWVFHPPYPTYVAASGIGDLGTLGSPYIGGAGLVAACDRAKLYNQLSIPLVGQVGTVFNDHRTKIPVQLAAGEYVLSDINGVLDCEATLIPTDGPIILK